jgi:hypothetical protein
MNGFVSTAPRRDFRNRCSHLPGSPPLDRFQPCSSRARDSPYQTRKEVSDMGYMASLNANKIAEMEQLEQEHTDDFIEALQLTDTEKAELEVE